MALVASDITPLLDNVAKSIVDYTAAFNSGTSSAVTTITSGQTGASNSLQARIAGLNNFSEQLALVTGINTATTAVVTQLGAASGLNPLYLAYIQFMQSLEVATSGFAAWLATNTVMVHPSFAAAFNYYATNAVSLGLRGTAPTSIPASSIFPSAAVDPMGSIAVLGATSGTFTAGSVINTANNGAVPLYLVNTSAGNAAAATQFQVTYVNAAGTSTTVNKTITIGMQTGTANGVTLGVSGTSVTGITILAAGTTGESYKVTAPLLRTVAY